jgi:hypothetical protein
MIFRKKILLALLFSVALSSGIKAQSMSAPSAQPKLKLGYVKNGDIGCGCSYSSNVTDLRNRRYIFIESMDEPAYINLNGRNLKLRPVASSKTKGEEKAGRRSWETYIAGDLKIRLDKIVTKVCDPNDEACEVTSYKATMTVTRKAEKTIVRHHQHAGGLMSGVASKAITLLS